MCSENRGAMPETAKLFKELKEKNYELLQLVKNDPANPKILEIRTCLDELAGKIQVVMAKEKRPT